MASLGRAGTEEAADLRICLKWTGSSYHLLLPAPCGGEDGGVDALGDDGNGQAGPHSPGPLPTEVSRAGKSGLSRCQNKLTLFPATQSPQVRPAFAKPYKEGRPGEEKSLEWEGQLPSLQLSPDFQKTPCRQALQPIPQDPVEIFDFRAKRRDWNSYFSNVRAAGRVL